MNNERGIYQITNLIDGKVYIGQSANLRTRKQGHFNLLNRNTHKNRHLQMAYNKYGKENFVFKVLLYCEPFELTRYEQEIVNITSNIYNLCLECVDSCKGIKRTEETKLKMSNAIKGRTSPFKGRHHSEESKQKQVASHLGSKNPNYGKHFTEEHKRKIVRKKADLAGIIVYTGGEPNAYPLSQ